VRGWRKQAPKTLQQRRRLLKKCGREAFLKPDTLAFPIMAARTRTCSVSCKGLLAAKARAGQFGHRRLEAKAQRLGERHGCGWAR